MRLFSRKDLERKLAAAGFETIIFQTEAVPRFGIAYEGDWSLPMVARKGRASYLGERSAGHKDPGATSSALLVRTLAESVA